MAERTSLKQIRDAGKRKKAGTDIGVIGALADPQFREDVLRGLGETSARGVAGVLGAPVDLTTMALRPFGYSVPAEQVVGGSDYLGRQMERAGLISGERRPIAEMLGGIMMPDPLDVAKLGAMAVPAIGKALDPAELKRLRNEAIGAKDEFDRYYSAVKRREVEPTAEDYFGRSTEMADAQERLAAKMSEIPDEAFGFQSRTSDGRLTMITPSSKKAGHYQVTYFDKKGEPFGDTLYPSREQALNEFLKESDLRTVQGTGQYLPQYHTAAPRDEAMRIAQANAAKPTSEGGLGLRPDNTAMERAQAMGFDTEIYHGSSKEKPKPIYEDGFYLGMTEPELQEITSIGKGVGKGEGGAFFGTDVKSIARGYAAPSKEQAGATYPLMVRSQDYLESGFNKPMTGDEQQWLDDLEKYNRSLDRNKNRYFKEQILKSQKEGKGGAVFRNTEDAAVDIGSVPPSDIYAITNAPVRSRFAAFDPAKRYESDLLGAANPVLLGSIAAGTGAGLYGYNQRQKEKEKRPAK